MGRIYSGAIDIADAGTDADQDIFVLASGSANKVVLHEFEIYSDTAIAASLKLELVRRTGAGTGGTAITEEEHDPDNTVANTCSMTTDAETPGTISGAALKNFWWEQIGPLIYRPAPEDRIIMDVSQFLALNLLTSPANAAIGGYVTWEEI
jgi:hypothetical protein